MKLVSSLCLSLSEISFVSLYLVSLAGLYPFGAGLVQAFAEYHVLLCLFLLRCGTTGTKMGGWMASGGDSEFQIRDECMYLYGGQLSDFRHF